MAPLLGASLKAAPYGCGSLHLVIHAEGPSIQEAAKFAGMTGVPDLGQFRLAAKLAGAADKLSLDQVDFQAGSEECEVKVQGSIKDPLAPQEMDLHFSARGKDLARLDKLFGRAGILAVLTSASPDDQNPCLTAIEAAKKEGKAGQKRKGEKARRQAGRQGGDNKPLTLPGKNTRDSSRGVGTLNPGE